MSAQELAKRRRVELAAANAQPDRTPVSAWGHFFDREHNAEDLATASVDFYRRHDWDYLKVHARASYHVEGWGFRYAPSHDPAQGHACLGHPIRSGEDWARLAPLPITAAPFQEQLHLLRLIRQEVGPHTPLIMTVFSPLDVAEKLIDRDAALMRQHLQTHGDALAVALEAIADTLHRFVQALCHEGVDGIYFSTKWANHARLAEDQYQRLVRPADLHVLEAARPMWCNLLHLCEDNVQLAAMADYPVQVFHWDRSAGHNPSLSAGARELGKAVGGGVDAGTLARATPEAVRAMARDAVADTGGRGLLLGPGCSVQMARTPSANLHALRQAVEGL